MIRFLPTERGHHLLSTMCSKLAAVFGKNIQIMFILDKGNIRRTTPGFRAKQGEFQAHGASLD